MSGRPSAALFDIGNVIVRFDPPALYSKIFPDPVERDAFLSQVCTLSWHVEHDRGAAMAQTIPALIARFPHYADAIWAWRDRSGEILSQLIPKSLAAIDELAARGAPLYAITNMPAEWIAPVTALSPAFAHFRDIVVSAHEGVIKPDRRLFEIACARSGLEPGDFLFIDDSAANIDAAAAMGFHVHLFDDPAALRPALEAHGLL
jgi:2-haloacid dehalogenase/putative hydrolase of the HAD superfamily